METDLCDGGGAGEWSGHDGRIEGDMSRVQKNRKAPAPRKRRRREWETEPVPMNRYRGEARHWLVQAQDWEWHQGEGRGFYAAGAQLGSMAAVRSALRSGAEVWSR